MGADTTTPTQPATAATAPPPPEPQPQPPQPPHPHPQSTQQQQPPTAAAAAASPLPSPLPQPPASLHELLQPPRRLVPRRDYELRPTSSPPAKCADADADADADAPPSSATQRAPWIWRVAAAWGAPYRASGAVHVAPPSYPTWRDWAPSGLGSVRQVAYLVIPQSIGAAIISGAANFGVAVACYNHLPEVYFWPFLPLTVAGDLGVTILIQQIATILITSTMVHTDLTRGSLIAPLDRPWPPLLQLPGTPLGPQPLSRRLLWLLRTLSTGSERNDILAPRIPLRRRLERVLWTALQGVWVAALTFWWFWPISIAILAPIYEHRNMGGDWIPPIIKLVYGGLLGLLTNPILALLAMGAESSVRRAYPDASFWLECEGGPGADGAASSIPPSDSDVSTPPSPRQTSAERRAGGGGAATRTFTPQQQAHDVAAWYAELDRHRSGAGGASEKVA